MELEKHLSCIFVIQKLLNIKSVVIGVPSNVLQIQMKNEIIKIFPNFNNILFVGSDIKSDKIKSTTDKNVVKNFLNNSNDNNTECKFVITTYHSCHVLNDEIFNFDLKIGDEAHHLACVKKDKSKNTFDNFHEIKAKKTLFMTATPKIYKFTTVKKIYSMDDESIFGKLFMNKHLNGLLMKKS